MTAITHHGPYDVTGYSTWQAVLDANVSSGEKLVAVPYGDNILFMRVS